MTTKVSLKAIEDKVRAIHRDPSSYTLEECRMSDLWIKRFALARFEINLSTLPLWAANVLRPWAEVHFGAIEVDALMMELKCYPEWMGERNV